jgi:hypothetical protein
MSASAARIEANQANAQQSTGPRTEEGKARSALNAIKHGLTAASALLPSEDPAAYQRHLQDFEDEYQPQNASEQFLTRDLADTAWRLKRIPILEAALLSACQELQPPDAPAPEDAPASPRMTSPEIERMFRALSTHGYRLHRQFHKTLDQLRAIQHQRSQRDLSLLRDCAAIYKHHKDKGIPYKPEIDGFVFSDQEIESYIGGQIRAGMAHKTGYYLNSHPEHLPEALSN